MATTFVLALLSLYFSNAFAQNNFTVITPRAGDTVSLGDTALGDIQVPIAWTVAEAIADRPVIISLVQGNNVSSLSQVALVNSSAPNNGSYTWVEDGYNSPLEYRYNSGAPSGCNYSIALKVWTDTVYSGYFTIINPDDGGLATDAQCPEIGSSIGPMEQTFASSPSTSSGEDEDAAGTSTTGGSRSPTVNSGSGGDATAGGTRSGGGVSTTTLAVAVAVPVVVLLVAFGLILWLGRRKGWFVRRSSHRAHDGATAEKSGFVTHDGGDKGFRNGNDPAYASVRELHADDRPYQLESSPVHELQGGDGGPQYRIRN